MYGQYYNYGFSPMQDRLNQLQPRGLKGRPVGCIDEVKGCQIDLDGSITYFPCPSEGKIYTKTIDMNGCSVVQVYKLETANTPSFSQLNESINKFDKAINDLDKRIVELERRKNEPVTNVNATPTSPKPNGNVAEPSWEQPYIG